MTTLINGQYEVELLQHRHDFHEARPNWERSRLASCHDRIKPGMTVYDLGAEEGDFTALYQRWVGPSGHVVPVEPSLGYWPAIRQTWALNFGETLPAWWYAGFVSDVSLDNADDDDRMTDGCGWPQCSREGVTPDFGFRHLAHHADIIPQITIDDLAERSGLFPDVIVMDIEGAELRALQGATSVLSERRTLCYVSVHQEPLWEWYGQPMREVHKLMQHLGYDVTWLGCEIEEFFCYSPKP